MDAMQAFFRKYHGVPAGNSGPNWKAATDEALLGWAVEDCRTWDETTASRPHLRARMLEVGAELRRRNGAATAKCDSRFRWAMELAMRVGE